MEFTPIAIVGQGCVLPKAFSPQELWLLVAHGQDALTSPPPGYWGGATATGLTEQADPGMHRLVSNRGGYIHRFKERFDPEGFQIPAEQILTLDPLFQWILYAGREALLSAGHDIGTNSARLGAIFGNLSYPTRALVDFAERIWWSRAAPARSPAVRAASPDPRNRFTSGLPAHILAQALGLGAGAWALDAACASSLYAIKFACDRLHDGQADLMLAGGVNAADGFIIHGGFSVLQAISQTGRSRPFHRQADGLVPAEGAAFVVLKRLQDAEAAGDRVLGVIRGIGVSNDGRGEGFLVPSETAQTSAMHQAYAMAGLDPADISLVECHATGTLVGDAAEIRSMSRVFESVEELPIGSLKSNLGHLITAAGAAGLLKVLAAMQAGVRPPTLHADEPLEALAGTPFRLVHQAEPWQCRGPLRAGVSSFGFGGNNAHLIVEQWSARSWPPASAPLPRAEEVAIVAVGIVVADCKGRASFTEALCAGRSFLKPRPDNTPAAPTDAIELDLSKLRFPPHDLQHTLPQQLLILEAAVQISAEVAKLPAVATGVFVGMQCDAEGARIAARCRLPQRVLDWCGTDPASLADAWLAEAYAGMSPPLTPAGVIGAMPNIVANRLNSCFDLQGPGFSVSAEELSGMMALELGVRALRCGELDAALVGAVDLSCEPVHEAAAAALFPEERQSPADAAVIMILKRVEDARRAGDTIYAVLPAKPLAHAGFRLGLDAGATSLLPLFGHAHAACGLLHVAAAALACYHRALPVPHGPAMPWLPEERERTACVSVNTFSGQTGHTWLKAAPGARPAPAFPVPRLRVYTAEHRDGLWQALQRDEAGDTGALRLVIVSRDAGTFQRQREQAMAALQVHREAPRQLCELAEGIYLGEVPLAGDLAFVFTGPAGAYPQMGRDLLLALPELVDSLSDRFAHMRQAAGWLFDPRAQPEQPPVNKLWGASLLCQIHAEFTRGLLGLTPQAAIGFCSGESNALFALGAWSDLDRMHQEIEALGVFSRQLGGDFEAVRRSWKLAQQITWGSWRIFAPVAEVRTALASEPRVHLTIVSTPEDVVIAGDADDCQRVIGTIGSKRAQPLGYDVVMHCPEAEACADVWWKLHHRPTTPPPGVRFYTHATCSHYEPTAERVADMLTRQAMRQVDFPRLIENAWQDGVRVFIEHGPLSGCTRWIQQILGTREHLALALDRYGTSSLLQAADTVAQLVAIGMPVDYRAFVERLGTDAQTRQTPETSRQTVFSFAAHWDPVQIPHIPEATPEAVLQADAVPPPSQAGATVVQVMEPAPWLPPVSEEWLGPEKRSPSRVVTSIPEPPEATGDPHGAKTSQPPAKGLGQVFHQMAAYQAQVTALHQTFLHQQSELQQRFVQLMQNTQNNFIHAYQKAQLVPRQHADDGPGTLSPRERAGGEGPQAPEKAPRPHPLPKGEGKEATSRNQRDTAREAGSHAVNPVMASRYSAGPPRGPRFSREQLKIHASGQISALFGPRFEPQDGYLLQVRLPEEPWLLVDRVTGIDAEPGSMQPGTLWTESDVQWDSWYLQHGRMPAGIMVEAGQADLMLISWLGVDFLNQGRRVYRLLGCEGTYYGGLPKPGDTLCYDIHVDGYARQGEVLLFFFHYDCRINGELRLSIRNGHAGFFTEQELQASQGILWDPRQVQPQPGTRVDPPAVCTSRSRFTAAQVRAFSEGRVLECFGPGFERAQAHTRTARSMAGRMCLLDEVEVCDPAGGPWARGYLRCVTTISPDDWFFQGHFKNDPCMPGTLMFQACLEAMAFYLTAMGYTLERDGWRFEPVTEETYTLTCRGQAIPASQKLVYEIFVEELTARPFPTLYADMLCTVDGLKAFHGQRIGLRLVPDWPLESERELVEAVSRYVEPKPVAGVEDFAYGYPSLLACAWGRPSRAFGDMYRVFDSPRRVARLPGPPYHFISRVCSINAPRGGMHAGSAIEVEYDVPADAWYFEHNGAPTMPLCVLLESALQPCGWLASYAGCTLTTEQDLYFRNLDGTARVYTELFPDAGTLRTRTTLKSISQAGGIILVAFDVEIFTADRRVCEVDTAFGFFTAEALANQTGLPTPNGPHTPSDTPSNVLVDLRARPARYFDGTPCLPAPMLLMIDRITGYWPQGGKAGLGRARAEKSIDPSEWFFKAHFFQDPVQPGTLGLEAMIQLLQFVMLHRGLGRDIPNPRFEPVALGHALSWKYRGQVLPENRTVVIDLELVKIAQDARGVWASAEASLWVDSRRIYHASGLGMRIVSGEPHKAPPQAQASSAGNGSEPLLGSPQAHPGGPATRPEEHSGMSGPASSALDVSPVRAYWRAALGVDHCSLSEDLYMALLEKYVKRVVLQDPEAWARIRGRSVLFLGNHQVAIETPLLMILAAYLSQVEVFVLAKAEHQKSWMGELFSRTFGYPGIRQMHNIIYFHREDQKSAVQTLERLKRDIFGQNRSLMVHVEGTRSRTCREPVQRVSALFLDMAVEMGIPIVPVRFVGGLPVAKVPQRLEFPMGHGCQDYYVGAPIFPDLLRRAPYARRKQIVVDAINALGPSNAQEEPYPGDPEFAAAIEAWHRTTKAPKEYAALFTALQRLQAPGAQTTAVLAGASQGTLVLGSDAYGKWLGDFARLLYGPQGPSVREMP